MKKIKNNIPAMNGEIRIKKGGAREGQSVIAAHLACKHESLAWAKTLQR